MMKRFKISYTNAAGEPREVVYRASDAAAALGILLDTAEDGIDERSRITVESVASVPPRRPHARSKVNGQMPEGVVDAYLSALGPARGSA